MQSVPKLEEWYDGELRVLENGLTVWAKGYATAKEYAVVVNVAAGSVEDPLDQLGCAHCFEHIPFRGAGRFSSKCALVDPIEEWDGAVYAVTSPDLTQFGVTTDPVVLSHSLEAIAAMVQQPHFTGVEAERDTILQEYFSRRVHIEQRASDDLLPLIFRQPNLGHSVIGTPANIQAMTADHLQAFHRNYYTADRMLVTIVGPDDTQKLLDKVSIAFAAVPAGTSRPYQAPSVQLPALCYGPHHQTWDLPATLIGCAIFFPLDPRLLNQATLLVTMLAEGLSAPLFQRLREKQSYCYSFYLSSTNWRGFSSIDFAAQISLPRLAAFWQDFWSVVSTEEGLNQRRLDWAKNSLIATRQHGHFSPTNVARAAGYELLAYGRVFGRNEEITDTLQVSLSDLQSFRDAYLTPQTCIQFVFASA